MVPASVRQLAMLPQFRSTVVEARNSVLALEKKRRTTFLVLSILGAMAGILAITFLARGGLLKSSAVHVKQKLFGLGIGCATYMAADFIGIVMIFHVSARVLQSLKSKRSIAINKEPTSQDIYDAMKGKRVTDKRMDEAFRALGQDQFNKLVVFINSLDSIEGKVLQGIARSGRLPADTEQYILPKLHPYPNILAASPDDYLDLIEQFPGRVYEGFHLHIMEHMPLENKERFYVDCKERLELEIYKKFLGWEVRSIYDAGKEEESEAITRLKFLGSNLELFKEAMEPYSEEKDFRLNVIRTCVENEVKALYAEYRRIEGEFNLPRAKKAIQSMDEDKRKKIELLSIDSEIFIEFLGAYDPGFMLAVLNNFFTSGKIDGGFMGKVSTFASAKSLEDTPLKKPLQGTGGGVCWCRSIQYG